MFKSIRRFISIVTSAVILTSALLPAATAQASSTGVLNVVVSPTSGIYRVLERVSGNVAIDLTSGSKTFTLSVGNYTVDFQDIPGYTTPADQNIALVPDGVATVTGIYQNSDPLSAILHVVGNPGNAHYQVTERVSGNVAIAETAGSQTFTLPYGNYVVHFFDLVGTNYTTPADASFSLNPGNTCSPSN